jgi:hypothetical protein
MNRFTAAALCGSLVFCGAQAFASTTSTEGTVQGESNTTAVKEKLMTDCMSHEAASNTGAKMNCQSQVENQLTDIKNAGTKPVQQTP